MLCWFLKDLLCKLFSIVHFFVNTDLRTESFTPRYLISGWSAMMLIRVIDTTGNLFQNCKVGYDFSCYQWFDSELDSVNPFCGCSDHDVFSPRQDLVLWLFFSVNICLLFSSSDSSEICSPFTELFKLRSKSIFFSL